MVEYDETITSFDAWQALVAQHPEFYRVGPADYIGDCIMQAGFTEPMTGRVVRPGDIAAPDGNWREGLIANGLNSRMRAVLALITEELRGHDPTQVRMFATEAVTEFALLLRGRFARFLGSEYGMDQAARDRLYPIPHQDLTALDLPSDMFDVVTTNEVLEHVPDLDAALSEIARVLKPGGVHIGTHPFCFTRPYGDVRARLEGGSVTHLMEPEYHGNPVDPEAGSLVFETPGWDILERAHAAGFRSATMRVLASMRQGYLSENTVLFVLHARK